ncbi:MAG: YlmC/YmxH family sporulation protein [Bacillota bacterium]
MKVRASDLRAKDVINMADGRRLGNLYDLDVDVESGRIRSLILPASGRPGWFRSRERDIEIPWQDIVKIGIDVILVDQPGSITPRPGSDSPA